MDTPTVDVTPATPPPPRVKVNRLTAELKALPAGGSFTCDDATARCYTAYARNHGFKAVQRKEADGRVRVWRLT